MGDNGRTGGTWNLAQHFWVCKDSTHVKSHTHGFTNNSSINLGTFHVHMCAYNPDVDGFTFRKISGQNNATGTLARAPSDQFSLLEIWFQRTWFKSCIQQRKEDNLSPFDLKIACLCQSIEINNKDVPLATIGLPTHPGTGVDGASGRGWKHAAPPLASLQCLPTVCCEDRRRVSRSGTAANSGGQDGVKARRFPSKTCVIQFVVIQKLWWKTHWNFSYASGRAHYISL